MSFNIIFNSLAQRLSHPRWPLLLYAATWTALLTLTVALASFSPELAFVSAISPRSSSSLSYTCPQPGYVRLPLDIPSEHFCFPGRVFKRSGMDMVVPPVFAAVIVAGSAFLVKALGLWETHEHDQDHHDRF